MSAVACALCGGRAPLWFEAAARAVHKCEVCGHIQVPAGLARMANGRSIYEDEDAVFTADGNAEYYLDETNMRAAEEKARFVGRHARGGTLVDVGASYGHFLHAVAHAFDAAGFEVSSQAVEYSQRQFHVRNVAGSVYDWPAHLSAPVDAITCWDVVEHLEDPIGAVRIMREHLKQGGWLFVSTPDAGATVARVMGTRWHYLDPVQHINVFSRRNLTNLLAKEGFAIRQTRSFGREYKVSYVLNRLKYLHRDRLAGRAASVALAAAGPIATVRIPIKLGDVMGIAAQRER